MSRVLNRVISLYGEDVTIKPRKEEVDPTTGRPTYSYPQDLWFTTKALLYIGLGEATEQIPIGYQDLYQQVAILYASLKGSLSPGDLLRTSDGEEFEIERITVRKRGTKIDFIEAILTQVKEES